jgi:hypothetical protein
MNQNRDPSKSKPAEPEAPVEQPQQGQDANKPGSPERPATNVSDERVSQFVTSLKNPAQQIGEHVIAALKHADTVAVLTTIVVGPGGQQHIISAALDPKKAAEVNALLMNAAEEREEEEPCVGFHCLVKRKSNPSSPSDEPADNQ